MLDCCRDLLRVQLSKNSLEVREDPVAGVHIPNLLSVDVNSCKQVLQLVATGEIPHCLRQYSPLIG